MIALGKILRLALTSSSKMSWGGWFGGAPAATDCVYPEIPTPTTPADFQEFLEKRFTELLANVSNDGWTKLEVEHRQTHLLSFINAL